MRMRRPTISIHPAWDERSDAIHYAFDLTYSDSSRRTSLFYEVASRPAGRPVSVLDGVLCATVLHAMAERRDIRLHGPASDVILRNLREFQLAWSRWLPNLYQPIDIIVDSVVCVDPPAERRSVAAFSGGVDSLFTVFQHNRHPKGPADPVHGALLVHGFDVKLENADDFEELADRTAAVREASGLALVRVRTNSKKLQLQTWMYGFAAELAACMHLCSADYTTAFIGSSEPYDGLVLPWGSNPVTDHLLSGGALSIVHDGAAFSRTEKVAFLTQFPDAVGAMKVCWEGERQGRNCGVCEKCVRTRLNFLAVGVADPSCFDGPLDLGLIAGLTITSDAVLAEFRSIRDYAEHRGITAEWLRLLSDRLRRIERDRTRHELREFTKTSLDRFGLLDTVQTVRRMLRPVG